MDIHSAMMHVFQLKSYLESAEQANTKMYSKTKSKYESIYKDLVECTHMVESILGDQYLDSVQSEFSEPTKEVSGSDDTMDFETVSDNVSELDETMDSYFDSAADSNTDSAMESTSSKNSESDEFLNHVINLSKNSSTYRRYVVHCYGRVLQKLSENPELDGLSNYKRCAQLLWKWYETRFFTVKGSNFRYRVDQIPVFVRNIILLFGKNIENNTVDTFCNYFDSWIESVQLGNSEFSCYAVPYSVFQLNKTIKPDDITLTANMLFDKLYDCGLNKLSIDELGNAALMGSAMYNLCDKYNPQLMENCGFSCSEVQNG